MGDTTLDIHLLIYEFMSSKNKRGKGSAKTKGEWETSFSLHGDLGCRDHYVWPHSLPTFN